MVLANSLSICSIPWRAIFASSGDKTPPCGVPSDVAVNTLWSMTPDFNQAYLPHDFLFLEIISVQVGYETLACG
jgi:hypothetical protein